MIISITYSSHQQWSCVNIARGTIITNTELSTKYFGEYFILPISWKIQRCLAFVYGALCSSHYHSYWKERERERQSRGIRAIPRVVAILSKRDRVLESQTFSKYGIFDELWWTWISLVVICLFFFLIENVELYVYIIRLLNQVINNDTATAFYTHIFARFMHSKYILFKYNVQL